MICCARLLKWQSIRIRRKRSALSMSGTLQKVMLVEVPVTCVATWSAIYSTCRPTSAMPLWHFSSGLRPSLPFLCQWVQAAQLRLRWTTISVRLTTTQKRSRRRHRRAARSTGHSLSRRWRCRLARQYCRWSGKKATAAAGKSLSQNRPRHRHLILIALQTMVQYDAARFPGKIRMYQIISVIRNFIGNTFHHCHQRARIF